MFERGDEVFLRGSGWGGDRGEVRVVDAFVQAVGDPYFWVWFEGEGERFVDSRLAWLGLVGNPDWNNQFEGAVEEEAPSRLTPARLKALADRLREPYISPIDDRFNSEVHGKWGVVGPCAGCGVSEGCVCAGVSGNQERVDCDLDEDTVTSPGYYKFPSGVEVRQISSYLTSNGGQSMQYITRSCRLDGNNKGDRVENLEKAIKFIEWEIERINGE